MSKREKESQVENGYIKNQLARRILKCGRSKDDHLLVGRPPGPVGLASQTDLFQDIPATTFRKRSKHEETGEKTEQRTETGNGRISGFPHLLFSTLCRTSRADPNAPFPICSKTSYCSILEPQLAQPISRNNSAQATTKSLKYISPQFLNEISPEKGTNLMWVRTTGTTKAEISTATKPNAHHFLALFPPLGKESRPNQMHLRRSKKSTT